MVLGDEGVDKSHHRLVRVKCPQCGGEKVMRAENVKRNRSCGCLKKKAFDKYRAWKRSPVEMKGNPYFAPFCNTNEWLGPSQIIQKAMTYAEQHEKQFVPMDRA